MAETKQCQSCKKDFFIEDEDFVFYKKIDVPPPTFCPECRRQRRHTWRNDLTFYSRECDRCKKRIISLYSPDKSLTVYCQKCWWSDEWDPKSYGKDVDFSRPFFEQYNELQKTVPLIALVNDDGVGSVNCEYTQNTSYAKNCYMISMTWKLEDCMYDYHVGGPETKEAVDCNEIFINTERVYDCIFLNNCYNCRHCYYSANLINCALCYDCRDCSDCFLSAGLRHKKYCILNKQYSKEEYENILGRYRLDTWTGMQKARGGFFDMVIKYPRRFADIRNSTDCTGDSLFNCKNMKYSFSARKSEDCKYFESGNEVRGGYDMTVGGENNECYEGLTPDHDYRALFTIFSYKNTEVLYCENCHASKHLFGCSSIKHGEYCILNKVYSKEEYFALKKKLIEYMTKTGEWGEFFPSRLSHFGYNETIAQLYFPLKKEEALKRGFKWQDKVQFTTGKETMRIEDLADSIQDVSDNIISEILACMTCGRNYRIIPPELKFYRKVGIPLPRQCFFCRNKERLEFRNPYKLWHRQCMCELSTHFHNAKRCQNVFETPYAPDRPEIVYCEQCYNTEVI